MRLKQKLIEALRDYLGKDHVDFGEEGRDLVFLAYFSGKMRVVNVYFPHRRPVLFIIDFGYFTPTQMEYVESMYQGCDMSMRIGTREDRLILTFEQILTEDTVESVVPELVGVLESDIGEMDDLAIEAAQLTLAIDDPDDETSQGEPAAAFTRPPGTLLN